MAEFIRRDGTKCRRYDWRESRRFGTQSQLGDWVLQYQIMDCGPYQVVFGSRTLAATKPEVRRGRFLYCDHAYFDRGWDRFNFRLVRDGMHLHEVLRRPADRLKRWGVEIEPWRKGGRSVVVIPPGPYHYAIYDLPADWTERTVRTLQQHTDRPIVVKPTKGRLREMLLDEVDAHALVCHASVAGMEAALMGVPVYSSEHCCSAPVSSGGLERIETPSYPERYEWACGLAYASWNAEELESIDFRDYYYTTKEMPCA